MSQPSLPSAALEFPNPPSLKDTKADPAATLAWLKINISIIYRTGKNASPSQDKPPALSRSAYLSLYTTAHNYCEITKHAQKAKPTDPEPLTEQDLYRYLEEVVRNYCSEVRGCLSFTLTDSTAAVKLIEEYLSHFNMLTQHLSPLVAHLLGHLERHWINSELQHKTKGVYSIRDLHTVIWEEVFQVGGYSTTATAVSTRSELERALGMLLREEAEGGLESDRKDLAERFLESLKTIGVDWAASV